MLNMQLRPCTDRGVRQLRRCLAFLGQGMRLALLCMRQAGAEWYRQDFPLTGYLFKYLLAALLALWVALKMVWDGWHDVAPVLGWPHFEAAAR